MLSQVRLPEQVVATDFETILHSGLRFTDMLFYRSVEPQWRLFSLHAVTGPQDVAVATCVDMISTDYSFDLPFRARAIIHKDCLSRLQLPHGRLALQCLGGRGGNAGEHDNHGCWDHSHRIFSISG